MLAIQQKIEKSYYYFDSLSIFIGAWAQVQEERGAICEDVEKG